MSAAAAVRKVKSLLTGLAPTDAEVMSGATADGLRTLITTWTTGSDFQPLFHDKMVFFFRNAFQQTGFTPTEDFKMQLLENGGFDFGPLGTGAVGDDAFARLVQNLQDSFALHGVAADRRGPSVHRRAHHAAVHDDDRAQEPVPADRDAERPAVRVRQHRHQARVEGRHERHRDPARADAGSDQPELHGVRRPDAGEPPRASS